MNKMYTTRGARRNPGFVFSRFLMVALLSLSLGTSWGQLSITTANSAVTQNFDALASTGTLVAQTGGIFNSGWSFTEGDTNGNTTYDAGTGSSGTGNTYSFGVAGTNVVGERAFGMLQSGSLSSILGFKFTNNTGSTITSITIGYTGEVWRLASAADNLAVSYQSGNVALNASSGWTNVAGLAFTTPNTGTAAAVDGNATANRTVIAPVTITGLSIANGTTYTIRWVDATQTSSAGMGIDNFTITLNTPTITGAATAAAFTTTYGTASTAQSFSISGSNLTANLIATAPTGFEVSSDGTTYAGTATFIQTSGSASGTLRIRLAATAPVSGSYNSQNIVLSSTGATSVNITTAASGNVVNKATPTITTAPTATTITFGQTLVASTLSGGVASVAGTFAFTTPSTQPNAGTASQPVTFTPTDAANYNTASTSASVTVNKATPTITTAPTATAITFGQTLTSSTLSGGVASVPGTFAFTTPSTAPNAGTASQPVTFTPTDAANYNTVSTSASVTVNPAPVTITPNASQSKPVGSPDPVFTFSSNPNVTTTGALSRVSGETIGTYAYTLGTLSAGSNYTLSLGGAETFAITTIPQATADYVSTGNVTTSSASNWQYDDGTGPVAATVPPTSTNNVTLSAGHTLTVDMSFTVGSGKTFLMESTTATTMVINPNIVFTITGTANFNGQSVTVKSTSAGTGSIGQVTLNALTNATNVTVERYIDSDKRTYRSLAPSVNTAGGTKPFIRDNWQEGANNPDLTMNVNGGAGNNFGTHISGSTSESNLGFDPTFNGIKSLYTYNGTTGYSAVANTNATSLEAQTGYLLFVRGDRRDITRLDVNASSSTTTLRATGTLLSGPQTYTLNGNSQFTLVTNPYASAINWAQIYTSNSSPNLSTFYTYVDPRAGTQGGYVTVGTNGVNNLPGTYNANANIQSGQAFFVKATGSTAPTFTITEAHKSTINNVNVFRTGSQEQLSVGLYFDLNGNNRVADGVNVLFNNNYSADVDGNDAEQIANFDEDISINRGGKFLAIEGRPLVDQFDTISLNMIRMKVRDYHFEFLPAGFNAPGLQAYLQDKFLGTETSISLTEQTNVNFSVSSTTGSAAADRFRIVFKNITVLPINFTLVKAFEKGNAIQVEWNLGNESSLKQYEIEKSTDGRTFTKVSTQTKRAQLSTESYNWLDASPITGNNYYRIKAIEQNGEYKYSQVVNVKVGKGNSAITIYPNPVKGSAINLQMVNQPKGQYNISLTNAAGQQVYQKLFEHAGGSASTVLQLNNRLAKGIYQLQISSDTNKATYKVVSE